METTIPFDGFYNSIHDEALTNELDQVLSDSRGNAIDGLIEKFWDKDSIDWGKAHNLYAKEFTENFAYKFGVAVTYKLMDSPKFYNFTTDRIFCKIELAEVKRLFAIVDKTVLDKAIVDAFTSYDGFSSFYKNSLDQWPSDLSKWDHNQVGTLLNVYVRGHDAYEEYWQSETIDSGNGELNSIINDALKPDGLKIVKVANYIVERQERKFYKSAT